MLPQYEKELIELRERMEKAEAFSKKLPAFASLILEKKITGEEGWVDFGRYWRGLSLRWGINRRKYSGGEDVPLNYHSDFEGYLFEIYINSYDLFDVNNNYDLEDVIEGSDYFYFDPLNTRFYATDEQITQLLNDLSEWFERAKIKHKDSYKTNRLAELRKELEQLEGK